MEKYSIFFRKSVESDFKKIPKRDLQRIMQRIFALAQDSRPHGSEKLSGRERYRVRQGKYRIVYSIQDEELIICIVKVGHRKDVNDVNTNCCTIPTGALRLPQRSCEHNVRHK